MHWSSKPNIPIILTEKTHQRGPLNRSRFVRQQLRLRQELLLLFPEPRWKLVGFQGKCRSPSNRIEWYCWWFRNPASTSWGNGSLSHYLQGFSTIPGGCLGFLPSTVCWLCSRKTYIIINYNIPGSPVENQQSGWSLKNDPWIKDSRSYQWSLDLQGRHTYYMYIQV